MCLRPLVFIRCFFAIPATTEIYTLSLHDALPIWSKPLLFTVGLRNRFTLCVPALKQLRSEEHTSELQSLTNLVCRLLLEKKKHTILAADLDFTNLFLKLNTVVWLPDPLIGLLRAR